MPIFNVIQETYPDGHHRWKFFTYAQSYGPTSSLPLVEEGNSVHQPGWTISRKEIENAKRAKQTVYELARSNRDRWDWFVTLTFDPLYVCRQDYRQCYRYVSDFCARLTRLGCCWLFVPEHHKDGCSFHFHGLVGGEMELVFAGYHGHRGFERPTYNVLWFPGYTSVQPIEDRDRVTTYITKYITKDLVHLVPKGCHRYLHSRDLLKPTVEYLTMTEEEFCSLVNYGEFFDRDHFEEGLSNARFVKKVPLYFRLNQDAMYIVED